MIQTAILGTLRGKSGRDYVVVGAEGECAVCGTPFGVRTVIDPTDPVPAVAFVHDGDGAHHLEMDGNSEAAKALRDGTVIAHHAEGLAN